MKPYCLYPHQHVRVWVSKDEQTFLPHRHRLNLIRFREKLPEDKLTFVYSKALLSEAAELECLTFCEQHKIMPLSIEEISEALSLPLEKKVMACIEIELEGIKNDAGGNPAAISDMLRLLSPIHKRGIYSDFDTDIDTRGLPETILMEKPFLVMIGSVEGMLGTFQCLYINNDIVAFPEVNNDLPLKEKQEACKRQQSLLASAHQNLIDAYEEPRAYLSRIVEWSIETLAKTGLNKHHEEIIKIILLDQYKPVMTISKGLFGDDLLSIRKNIDRQCSSNNRFVFEQLQFILSENPSITSTALGSQISDALKEEDYEQLKTIFEQIIRLQLTQLIFFSSVSYGYNNAVRNTFSQYLDIQSRDEFLSKWISRTYNAFYKATVSNITGSQLFFFLLDKNVVPNESIKSEIQAYSWQQEGLANHFHSKGIIPFFTSENDTIELLNKQGSQDLSWLKEGEDALLHEERKMQQAASVIQRALRNHFIWKKTEQTPSQQPGEKEMSANFVKNL